jgi:hypothetical protein
MGDLNTTTMILMGGAATGGALLAVAGSYFFFGRRSKELLERLDKADKSRARTNDMLMQARRQAEALQKEMLSVRSARPAAPAAPPSPAAAQAARAENASHLRSAATQHPLSQAALEQSQALARSRERAKAMLEDELDRTVVLHRPPGGFAETQPLSQL